MIRAVSAWQGAREISDFKVDSGCFCLAVRKEIFDFKFDSHSKDDMLESCIRIEMICNVESLKKDEKIRKQIQLKILTEKFNKAQLTKKDEIFLNVKNFFLNLSISKSSATEKNLWKRIISAIKTS